MAVKDPDFTHSKQRGATFPQATIDRDIEIAANELRSQRDFERGYVERKKSIDAIILAGKQLSAALDNSDNDFGNVMDKQVFARKIITMREFAPDWMDYPDPPLDDIEYRDIHANLQLYTHYITKCAEIYRKKKLDAPKRADPRDICVLLCYSLIDISFGEGGLKKIVKTGPYARRDGTRTLGNFYALNVELFAYALGIRYDPHVEGGNVFQSRINKLLKAARP